MPTLRGKAVEHGINCFINGYQNKFIEPKLDYDKKEIWAGPEDKITLISEESGQKIVGEVVGCEEEHQCVAEAVKMWEEGYVKIKELDPESELKELEFRQSIGACVMAGIQSVRDKYNPAKLELQVEIGGEIPGCVKPMLGFIDWLAPGKKVIDCKVVNKTPSKIKQGYIIQGAVYHHYTDGLPVEFHFIVPLKGGVGITVLKMTDAQYKWGWEMAKILANKIEVVFDNLMNLDHEFMQAAFMVNPDGVFNKAEMDYYIENYGLPPSVC